MRTVASKATDSSIIRVATAAEESIRLETHIEHSIFGVSGHHLFRSAVARAAELLTDLVAAQSTWIEDQVTIWPTGATGGDMSTPWTVA